MDTTTLLVIVLVVLLLGGSAATLGLIGFGASSIACGLSPTMEVLIVARLVQGAFGALLAVSALAVAVAGAGLGGSATNAASPIVIGWAFDSKGNMAPFDNPALAAAKIRVAQVNRRGGVNGRPLRIRTCDTRWCSHAKMGMANSN